MIKRILSVLAVAALLVATMVAGSGVAFAAGGGGGGGGGTHTNTHTNTDVCSRGNNYDANSGNISGGDTNTGGGGLVCFSAGGVLICQPL